MSRTRGLVLAAAGPAAVALVLGTAGCGAGRASVGSAESPPAAAPAASAASAASADPTGLLAEILLSHPGLRPVAEAAEEHRLQVVLGRVEPGSDGRPRLVQETFRPDAEYLYPASTVKLFAAVAALERLAELREETGLPIDADTRLVFHPLFPGEEPETTTVARDVRAILVVSDNAAFNRLYELVGPDRLAVSLERAGLPEIRIVHRLSERRSVEENRRSPRIELVGEGFRHVLPERSAPPIPARAGPGPRVGDGWIDSAGERVDSPMEFSDKNHAPLAALQRGLCRVVRPDVDCGSSPGAPAGGDPPPFRLSDADRALLVEAMGQTPSESEDPVYDPEEYPDAYVKFVLPGLARVVPRERLRVYDKSGQAYGFTTENAYVVDRTTGRGFFLAASLYTNADGVLNDDRYEYEEVALPFLADLGEAVARHLWGAP